ncbi:MAG: hypothetical protein K1000chlam2_01388 [Chlamydiae bacterium]|nr:hypothetical protein [Chlamydiota bacterium]
MSQLPPITQNQGPVSQLTVQGIPAKEKSEIPEAIKGLILKVTSITKKSTGFFFKIQDQILIATTVRSSDDLSATTNKSFDTHVLKWSPAHQVSLSVFQEQSSASSRPEKKQKTTPSAASLPPPNLETYEGQPVYYAGYPLDSSQPTYHKGRISAINETVADGIAMTYYTIDGTALPGHSGSPVFVYQDSQIYLIGMIVTQMIDSSTQLSQLERNPNPDIQLLTTVMKNNLSTGIIKVIDTSIFRPIFHEDRYSPKKLSYEGCVTRPKDMDFALGKTGIRVYSQNFIGNELFPTNSGGAGPRGIAIWGKMLGRGKLHYWFDEQPHEGKYNKAQSKLYQTAIHFFESLFVQGNPPPSSFVFTCYKQEFNAQLE